MAVRNVGGNYRCNICGNEVVVTKVGGGELVCCGFVARGYSADSEHLSWLILEGIRHITHKTGLWP